MRQITDAMRDQIAQEYANGDYIYAIAQRHKVSESTVTRAVKARGLPQRGRGCPKGIKHAVYAKVQEVADA